MTDTTLDFTHDIFISYRNNDNKTPAGSAGEGWVTEFVNHLSAELETMVKGKFSIYFDQNPHDGLREHHRVDDSLTHRLSALIFIPILSQTYCDQECFAWKSEFLPFLKTASQDSLGSMVKLQNGNVAGRVLPVCIHDLEQADLRLIESQLDGKLRAINFVYKSPGVNRPLRAHEVDPLKNANHTFYRDQVNKVANAIREIINSVRASTMKASNEPAEVRKKNPLLDGLLSTTGVSKSITVLPLVFKSQNPDEEFLSQGFSEDLFSSLKQIKGLRTTIHGLSPTMNGKGVHEAYSSSTMILTGNMHIADRDIGIQMQLVQTMDNSVTWEAEYQCDRDKLFTLKPSIIAQICKSLSVKLHEREWQAIECEAEVSAAALELYWKGRYHWRKRGNDLLVSMDCFQKATDLAPGFVPAYAGIANTAALLGYYEMIPLNESINQCKESALKALSIDPTFLEAYYSLAFVSLCYELVWPDSEQSFVKAFGINPGSPSALRKFKLCLTHIQCSFEEAGEDPLISVPRFLHAYSLIHQGKFEEGLHMAQTAIKKDPGSFMAQRAVGLCYLGMGYEREAIEALNAAAQISNRHRMVLFDLIGAYATLANNDDAQSIMEEVMDRTNALPARINDFFFQSV